jgi:ribosomal protein L22
MELLEALTNITTFAEIPDYGANHALDILQNYSYISNKLGESFQTLWDGIIFDIESSYWRAVISGALDFALLGIFLFAWNGFKSENDNRQKLIVEGFAMITILGILLGGNGFFTSQILAVTHSFDINLNRTLAKTQVLDLSIADALKDIALSQASQDKVNKLLAECQVLQANESLACLEKQIPEIEEIVKQAELQDPIANSPAGKYARGVLDYLKDLASNAASGNGLKAASIAVNNVFFGNPFIMGAIKLVFGGIQLAFNFALETASILHALLLPLVISTIFTPLGSKYTETWIQGYVQIVSIKFLYIALIGLTAQAIVVSQAQFATGIAFLIFSSVMGPMVAFLMAKGGGANLAKFVASSTTSALFNTVQGATTLATGGAGGIGSLVGKGLFKAGSKGLARRTTQRSR